MQAEHFLRVLVSSPTTFWVWLAPNILSSVCLASQGISRNPFHIKVWAGLKASRRPPSFLSWALSSFVLLSLPSVVPLAASIESVQPHEYQHLFTRWVVSLSAPFLQGSYFPSRITTCHFFAALSSCWPGPSFGYSSCRMSYGFLTGGQGATPLQLLVCWWPSHWCPGGGELWKSWCAGCQSPRVCYLPTDCGLKSYQ